MLTKHDLNQEWPNHGPKLHPAHCLFLHIIKQVLLDRPCLGIYVLLLLLSCYKVRVAVVETV